MWLKFAILIQYMSPGKYIEDHAYIESFALALHCFFIISILCFTHVHRFLEAVALCMEEKYERGHWVNRSISQVMIIPTGIKIIWN